MPTGTSRTLVLGLFLSLLKAAKAEVSVAAKPCEATFQSFLAEQKDHLGVAGSLAAKSTAQEVLPHPEAGVTLFVPEDESFGALEQTPGHTKYAIRKGAPAELASRQMPAEKLESLLLYWSLPTALNQKDLIQLGEAATGLSLVTKSKAFDLQFSAAGSKVNISGKFQSTSLERSYAVCNSWVHTTSAILWPSQLYNAAYIPDPIIGGRPQSIIADTPALISSEDVFTPPALASAANAAKTSQRIAELVPILAGVLGGLLGVALLIILLLLLAQRSLRSPKRLQAHADAQLEKGGLGKEGSTSVRETRGSGAVLTDKPSIKGASTKLKSSSNASDTDRGSRLRALASPKEETALTDTLYTFRGDQRLQTASNTRLPETRRPKMFNAFSMSNSASANSTDDDPSTVEPVSPTASGSSKTLSYTANPSTSTVGAARSDSHGFLSRNSSWQLPAVDIELLKDAAGQLILLGRGGYGQVYRGRMNGTTDVACKVMEYGSEQELKRFLLEVKTLKDLRHINIVQFLGALLREQSITLVMELMMGGSLQDALMTDQKQELSWYHTGCLVALDIVRGVLHMHSRRVLHLDLKAANILLAKDRTAKIADVGLSRVLSKDMSSVSIAGSFDYMAPEVLTGQACNEKSDIWSLGCILWQIATGEVIRMRQFRQINVPEECPEEVRLIIQNCRQVDPSLRPSARQVFDRLRQSIVAPDV